MFSRLASAIFPVMMSWYLIIFALPLSVSSVRYSLSFFVSFPLFASPCVLLSADTVYEAHIDIWSDCCNISMSDDTSNPSGGNTNCGPLFRMPSVISVSIYVMLFYGRVLMCSYL